MEFFNRDAQENLVNAAYSGFTSMAGIYACMADNVSGAEYAALAGACLAAGTMTTSIGGFLACVIRGNYDGNR